MTSPSDPDVPEDRGPVSTAEQEPAPLASVQEQADLAGVIGTPVGRAVRLVALIGLIVLLGVTQGISMLIVVAAIVIMIFLHELGHYVMAKRAGMLVTEFFLGFGPRIWSFQRGETEYGLKAIPAGAYVKIIGMNSLEEVDPAIEDRTYRQGTFGQRIGVAVAGSTMHFLIALVLLFVQFAFISDPTSDEWVVGEITPASAAEAAGVRSGDQIVEFAGEPVTDFDSFRAAVSSADAGATTVVVNRGGSEIDLRVEVNQRLLVIGTIGEDLNLISDGESVVIAPPDPDGTIAAAGLGGGEQVSAINGATVDTLADVGAALRAGPDGAPPGTVMLEVADSAGLVEELEVDLGSAVEATEPTAFFGVGRRSAGETQAIPEAALSSVTTFGEVSWLSIQGVGKFLWPPNMVAFVADALSGGPSGDPASTPTSAAQTPSQVSENRPISIVGVAMLGSDLSSENLSNLVLFLAQINIFIGVFNLFPLLPFDGGHVVIACYERAQEARRRSKERYLADISRMLPVAYGVIIVLVVIGTLAVFMDVTRGIDI